DYLHRGGRTARAGESGSVVTLVLPNQRREMTRLMSDAGIVPQVAQVRSGEAELSRITGAQAPSGVPVVISTPVSELSGRPKSTGSSTRGRRSRPARTRRASAAPQARTGTSPSRPAVSNAA
ncbi:ATP-dependent helicase, partial [Streptomyces niveus]